MCVRADPRDGRFFRGCQFSVFLENRYRFVMLSQFGNDSAWRFCPGLFGWYSRIRAQMRGRGVGAWRWVLDPPKGGLACACMRTPTRVYVCVRARMRSDGVATVCRNCRVALVAQYALRSHRSPIERLSPPGWGVDIPRAILSRQRGVQSRRAPKSPRGEPGANWWGGWGLFCPITPSG